MSSDWKTSSDQTVVSVEKGPVVEGMRICGKGGTARTILKRTYRSDDEGGIERMPSAVKRVDEQLYSNTLIKEMIISNECMSGLHERTLNGVRMVQS